MMEKKKMMPVVLALGNSLLLACTQNSGGSALEQMETEISRIAEQVRPSIVRISVKTNASAPTLSLTRALAHREKELTAAQNRLRLLTQRETPPAPKEDEEDMTDQADAEEHETALAPEVNLVATTDPVSGSHGGYTFWGESRRIGSGFSIGDGYILTTHTVAGGGSEATITIEDGKDLKGTIVGSDPETDIALIQVQDFNRPSVKLGDSSHVRIGSIGIFISNSYGKLQNVNFGFVTGQDESNPGTKMLRLNFPILPGESGGPLMNSRGEVIGMASANLRRNFQTYYDSRENMSQQWLVAVGDSMGGQNSEKAFSYFTPVDRLKGVIDDLKKYGQVRRPWFGVSGSDTVVEVNGKEQLGVLLETVQDNSAAQKAGLKVGDILLSCGGKDIPNFEELRRVIQRLTIGQAIEIAIRRDNNDMKLQITPEARPGMEKRVAGKTEMGINLVPKSKELAEYLNLIDAPEGKVVASIQEKGLAYQAGIRKGDLVLDELKPGKSCRIWRTGKTLEVTIPGK